MKPLIIVISGPGGAGKGTLVEGLLERDPKIWLSRSWTTRLCRPGESADAYKFVTKREFEARISSGGFLEWAEFLGNFYGTPVPEVPEGMDVLFEIDVQGARQLKAKFPEGLFIFVEPPDQQSQETRLRARGDDEKLVQARLRKAAEEADAAGELDAIVIVNDDIEQAVADVARTTENYRKRASTGA